MGLLKARKAALRFALLLATGALAGLFPMWWAAGSVAEIDVHGRPWRVHSGRLTSRFPAGQRFLCSADGLERIELGALCVHRPPRGGMRLRLYEEESAEPLRTAEVGAVDLPLGGGWISFPFEPLADSAGRSFRFEVEPTGEARPGDHALAVRVRGQAGHEGSWGWVEHRGPTLSGPLRHVFPPEALERRTGDRLTRPDESPHPHLFALAFAARGVAPRLGAVRLALWEEGADGEPLRSVELGPEAEVHQGWLLFAFEPIPESRWRRYRYELELHPEAVLLGDEEGPSMMSFHGLPGGDPRLFGMSLGGVPAPGRDLAFRAYCGGQRSLSLARLRERAGAGLWWALGAWVAASLLLAFAIAPSSRVAGSDVRS